MQDVLDTAVEEPAAAQEEQNFAVEAPRKIRWLASYPKSGNTWIRMFLDAYVTDTPLNINRVWRFATDDLQQRWYQSASNRPLAELSPTEGLLLRPAALMNLIAECPGGPVVKTHCARYRAYGIPLIPEELTACALYLIRDPRDVALSIMSHYGKPTLDAAIDLMEDENFSSQKLAPPLVHFISSWNNNVQSWATCDAFPVTVIRYEDLLRDPPGGFRLVLQALGIAIDDDKIARVIPQVTFDSLQQQENDQLFLERVPKSANQFFHKGVAGRWKTELSPDQASRIETHNRDMMTEFGYLE